jgi:lipopolysaccharide/colanic/teichoic acid biosynthesis glycosyltransferase
MTLWRRAKPASHRALSGLYLLNIAKIETMYSIMSEAVGAEWTLSIEKRIFDVIGMTALMPVVLPATAVAALAIRGIDHMNPLFVQSRLGLDLEPFEIYKLRTMPMNTPETPSLGSSSDPRATKLGRKLRKGHLDELPQAINVYNGSLSLVGLRGLIKKDVEDTLAVLSPSEQKDWRRAHRIAKPAVFGPFQLEQHLSDYGKGEINYRRAMSDIEYAETATFKGDLDILKRTALEGLGLNALFGREDSGHKRGQRGADMLKSVATEMGVVVSDIELGYWRIALLAARTIDDEVDNPSSGRSVDVLVLNLVIGNPIGDMTYTESKEFANLFRKLPKARQSRLLDSFYALPSLLLRKQSATSTKELVAVNKIEAAIFAGILQLEPDGYSHRQSFNNWVSKFTLAGYTADTFLDIHKDFEAGNVALLPTKLGRVALGARATKEIATLIKVTPARAYAPIIVSSVRTLAK